MGNKRMAGKKKKRMGKKGRRGWGRRGWGIRGWRGKRREDGVKEYGEGEGCMSEFTGLHGGLKSTYILLVGNLPHWEKNCISI